MKKKAHIAPFSDSLSTCSLCGICNDACPVFTVTGREADSPRGKVYLLRQWLKGRLSAKEITASLERCLLCGKCSSVCPAGLPLSRIFMAARLDLQSVNNLSRDLYLLINCLPSPLQNILQYPAAVLEKFLKDIPVFAKKLPPLTLAEKQFTQPRLTGKTGVLLFAGCMSRRIYPEIASACAKLLLACGYDTLMPPALSCCGQPHLRAGVASQASTLIKRNLKILAKTDFETLVSPCPECLHVIKNIWPNMPELTVEEQNQAKDIAARSMDIHAFLFGRLEPLASEVGAFWHMPCHMEATAAAKARALCGAQDCPSSGGRNCCGAPFGYKRRPLKKSQENSNFGINSLCHDIALDTASEILASGAREAIIPCPHCIARLRNAMLALGFSIPIRHSAPLLASAIEDKD